MMVYQKSLVSNAVDVCVKILVSWFGPYSELMNKALLVPLIYFTSFCN